MSDTPLGPLAPFRATLGDRYVLDFTRVMRGRKQERVAATLTEALEISGLLNGAAHEILSVLTGLALASTQRPIDMKSMFEEGPDPRVNKSVRQEPRPIGRGPDHERRLLQYNTKRNGGKPALSVIKGDKE